MDAAASEAMWGVVDLEEVKAWAFRLSALLFVLYPVALLAWTVAEGQRVAAATVRDAAPEPSAVCTEKRHVVAQQPRARRRSRLMPFALLAAAVAMAAMVGRAAWSFAPGANVGHTAPPSTPLAALPAQAEVAALAVGLEGRPGKVVARAQHTASHAARADQLPQLTPSELRQLRHGLPVQRQELAGSRGSGLFVVDVRAPPAVVFSCLQSFESYPGMIPSIRRAEVRARVRLGKGAFSARAHYKVSRFSLGFSVVHSVDEEAGTVDFNLDEACAKMVLQEAHGSWRVEPSPGGGRNETRVWLRIRLRASKLLPRWLLDYAAERALGRATSWLKPFMERLASQEFNGAAPCSSLSPLQLSAA